MKRKKKRDPLWFVCLGIFQIWGVDQKWRKRERRGWLDTEPTGGGGTGGEAGEAVVEK